MKRVTSIFPEATKPLNPVRSIVIMATRVPWERLLVGGAAATTLVNQGREMQRSKPAEQPQEQEPASPLVADKSQVDSPTPGFENPGGPGCRAADACLLVHGYLVNLADGKTGFGVLRVAKERMEEGAAGAERMGHVQLAGRMREVAAELPQVHTPEQAAALAPRVKELSDQTWDLGRRCGGHFSPELAAR